jgi:hypothetical protein
MGLVVMSSAVERLHRVGTSGGGDAGQEQVGDSIWSMNGNFLELIGGSRQ